MTVFGVFAILTLFLFTNGCNNIQSIDKRQKNVETIASQADLKLERIEAGSFLLTTYHKGLEGSDKNLVIYIEGDGNAWDSKYQLSENPTPKNPLALKLAAKDTADAILYIARPCMFLQQKLMRDCPARFWSSHRYSEEVISSINQVINWATEISPTNSLTLVGYSGGGTVAALIAARRNDVSTLVTIASNLDHRFWADLHHLSLLAGSLNPLDDANKLSTVEQIHFVGANDKIVPKSVVESYISKMSLKDKINIHVIDDFNHSCCWVKVWPDLLNTTNINQ
mgnify:CR=1 FL=1